MNLRNFLFSKLLTNLLLAIFIQGNVWQRLQDAYKFRREITEITSSINSRVRLWKINHSDVVFMNFTSGIFSSKTLVSI